MSSWAAKENLGVAVTGWHPIVHRHQGRHTVTGWHPIQCSLSLVTPRKFNRQAWWSWCHRRCWHRLVVPDCSHNLLYWPSFMHCRSIHSPQMVTHFTHSSSVTVFHTVCPACVVFLTPSSSSLFPPLFLITYSFLGTKPTDSPSQKPTHLFPFSAFSISTNWIFITPIPFRYTTERYSIKCNNNVLTLLSIQSGYVPKQTASDSLTKVRRKSPQLITLSLPSPASAVPRGWHWLPWPDVATAHRAIATPFPSPPFLCPSQAAG